MALKNTWKPRIDGEDDADSSAVNEIAEAVIALESIGAGKNGATFIPSVSTGGIISWTNDGNLPNPTPVNIKGADGKDGADGYTPVKGVDYYTEADKEEMVAAVLAALPNGDEVSY